MAKLTDSEYEHFTDILATADFGAATDWEMQFVADMKMKHKQWGRNVSVSDKQMTMLEKLAGEN